MKADSDSHIAGKFALPLLLFAVLLLAGCPNLPIPFPSSSVVFTAPNQLPDGTVGVPYSYSFCKPDLQSTSEKCGAVKAVTNPSGGDAPYLFTFDVKKDPLPSGLWVNLNGLLNGTPTAAGTWTFEVCTIDGIGHGKCRNTALTINPARTPTGCTKDADCSTGVCKGGVCMQQTGCGGGTCACTLDPDCKTGSCMDSTCWIPVVSVMCTEDTDCSTNLCEGGKCVDCQEDYDCNTGICEGGDCVQFDECTKDKQCPSNLCEGGICVDCGIDSDCDTGVCEMGVCTSPTVTGNNGWTGVWEGNYTRLEYKARAGSWTLDGCSIDIAEQYNLTQNGNELIGTVTSTVTKATGCNDKNIEVRVGMPGTGPIKWTATGNSADCSYEDYANLVAMDCTATLTGNNLNMKREDCKRPDPRCTCQEQDPRCCECYEDASLPCVCDEQVVEGAEFAYSDVEMTLVRTN